jgi:hypothetical protein
MIAMWPQTIATPNAIKMDRDGKVRDERRWWRLNERKTSVLPKSDAGA